MSGGEILFESLLKHGVDIVFGYPGGAIMPIYDAHSKYTHLIKHVLVGHEQGAVHAAEGYARTKMTPGICMATSGPGATNLITGIADAMMDSVPIICITGQVPRTMIGTEAFQETPIVDIVKPITKFAYQIKSADEIESILDKAFEIANSGRPGPVLIDIPKDVQLETSIYKNTKLKIKKVSIPDSTREDKYFLSLIQQNKKTLVLVGNGIKISRAENSLLTFLKKTDAYVATTLHGKDCIANKFKNNIGMLGMHGNLAANKAINEADLIVAIGMRFDDRVTGDLSKFGTNAKIIHIDIDKKQINKKVKTHLGIVADSKTFLERINKKINFRLKNGWGNFKAINWTKENDIVIRKEMFPDSGEINMAEVIYTINSVSNTHKIIIPDVGQHQMIAARYLEMNSKTKFISSGGLGTMGFSLPASIGSWFASPARQVISISGDGGFQMNIQELATIMRYKIPIKIFILNNSYLGMVRQWQELFFNKNESSVKLENPDFIGIANSYRIKAVKITKRSELGNKIQAALSHDGPVLVEVMCQMKENVFPIIPSGKGVDDMILE